MTKYHINAQGEVKPCKATKGNCPFGGAENHFDSFEAAQEVTDQINSALHNDFSSEDFLNFKDHESQRAEDAFKYSMDELKRFKTIIQERLKNAPVEKWKEQAEQEKKEADRVCKVKQKAREIQTAILEDAEQRYKEARKKMSDAYARLNAQEKQRGMAELEVGKKLLKIVQDQESEYGKFYEDNNIFQSNMSELTPHRGWEAQYERNENDPYPNACAESSEETFGKADFNEEDAKAVSLYRFYKSRRNTEPWPEVVQKSGQAEMIEKENKRARKERKKELDIKKEWQGYYQEVTKIKYEEDHNLPEVFTNKYSKELSDEYGKKVLEKAVIHDYLANHYDSYKNPIIEDHEKLKAQHYMYSQANRAFIEKTKQYPDLVEVNSSLSPSSFYEEPYVDQVQALQKINDAEDIRNYYTNVGIKHLKASDFRTANGVGHYDLTGVVFDDNGQPENLYGIWSEGVFVTQYEDVEKVKMDENGTFVGERTGREFVAKTYSQSRPWGSSSLTTVNVTPTFIVEDVGNKDSYVMKKTEHMGYDIYS